MTGIVQSLIGSFGSVVSAVTDAYFNLVTLLLPGNGTNGAQNNTFLDSSTNNFTITRNGNTTQGTFSPFSQTGWGNYFNGSTDYLSIADNAALELGSGSFTVEAWVWTSSTASQTVITKRNGIAAFNFVLYLSGGTAVQLYCSSNGSSFDMFSGASVGTITLNTWNHITIQRSGNNWYGSVNGTVTSLGTNSSTVFNNANPWLIGADAGANYVTGYISNVRIVTGSAVYGASNFTVPTTPLTAISGTQLLTCQSNRFIDNSTNAFAITVNGTPSVQAFSPFAPTAAYSAATNGGSGYFDGSGDYLTTNNINLAANAFTIEGWFYVTTTAGNMNYWGMTNGGGTTPKAVLYMDNAGNLVFETGAVSGAVISVSISTYVKRNAWQHIAISRSGTGASQTAMFIDGVRVGTGTCASLSGITAGFNIGYVGEAFGVTLNGYVSGFRIVNGTAVYNPASTTVTIPTAPLTAITNTALLTNFTNAGITDATAKNDLETVGNAQISTTQSKFGGSSMYFDGTGDYLDAPQSDLYSMRTGNFTLEFWVYFSSTSGTQVIYTGRNTTTPYIQLNSGALQFGFSGGPDNVINYTWNPSATTWYHVAFVRSSGTLSLYINGTSVASASNSTDWATPAYARIAANNSGASAFNGYLDDFRLTKGYARYTSNFTAPTAAFALQ